MVTFDLPAESLAINARNILGWFPSGFFSILVGGIILMLVLGLILRLFKT